MSKEKKDVVGVDILDQVKRIDKAIKAKLLIEKIAQLKEFAREINELKEKSVITLEELGLSAKDIKRVIDYINELPEVKLSDKDKKALREEVQEEVEEEKAEAEKKFRDVDISKIIDSFEKLGKTSTTSDLLYRAGPTSAGTMLGQDYMVGDSSPSSIMWCANMSGGTGEFTLSASNEKGEEQLSIKL